MTNDNNLNKGSFSRDDLNNRPPRKTTTRSTADRTRGTAKPTVKKTVNKTSSKPKNSGKKKRKKSYKRFVNFRLITERLVAGNCNNFQFIGKFISSL